MSFDLSIRQGDITPPLSATIRDPNGNPVDLTDSTVTFVMRRPSAQAPAVNATATVNNPLVGSVQYLWAPADTAASGLFAGEFHVTDGSGNTYTWPNQGYLDIDVESSLLTPDTELVSVADAKDHLNIPAADKKHDARLLRYIRGWRPVVEAITGPIILQQYEEWHDGGQTYIKINRRPSSGYGTSPVLQIQAISEYAGPIEWPLAIVASPDQGQLYSVMANPRRGRIVRRTAGGGVQPFPNMLDSVHVWYVAGQASVPDNVFEGVLELIRINWQATQQQSGLRLGGTGAGDVDDEGPKGPPLGFAVPGRVREYLQPNKRHPAIA
jgi:hypothetical protein